MIEHQLPMGGSGRPPDNIDRGTMLLWWTVVERKNGCMTISQTDTVRERFSVIACLAVLRIVTIFCLSYFLLIYYFTRMKYLCFCYIVCQLFLLFLCTHYKIIYEICTGVELSIRWYQEVELKDRSEINLRGEGI